MDKSIAYLTSAYARAGDTFIRREVAELRRLGWTVHTFSIRRAEKGEQVSEEILGEQRSTDYILEHGFLTLAWSFVRTCVRSPRRMLRAIGQARAIRWPGIKSCVWHAFYLVEACYLAEQLADKRIALLHDHIAMNSATVAMLASTLSGVPFSMTVHGPHDLLAADHWGLGGKIAASAMTVCISSFGKSQCMLSAPPQHWHKIQVVHCGLDDLFLGQATAPSDTRELVCVGRLSPEKGQVLLLDAVASLRDEGIDVEIVFVGDGPARGDIERRARELRIENRVRLVGWKNSADVRRAISESRALVLPSFAEGIPVVLMEAMALARPVITTYVGGIPELVRTADEGWLVPAGSVEELARAMREALAMPAAERQRMGERGRKRVLERHDVAVEVRKLAAHFERAILAPR